MQVSDHGITITTTTKAPAASAVVEVVVASSTNVENGKIKPFKSPNK